MQKQYATMLAVLVIAGIATAWAGFGNISLNDLSAENLGTKFLSVIFVALLIERAVEVFVSAEYAARESEIRRPIRVARLAVQRSQDNLDAEVARAVPDRQDAAAAETDRSGKTARVGQAQVELDADRKVESTASEKADLELEQLGAEKQKSAMRVSLLLSTGAAVVGFRVLGQFLPVDASGEVTGAITRAENQLAVFNAFDVIITALVLAGGAEGLHNLLGDFLSRRKDLAKPS